MLGPQRPRPVGGLLGLVESNAKLAIEHALQRVVALDVRVEPAVEEAARDLRAARARLDAGEPAQKREIELQVMADDGGVAQGLGDRAEAAGLEDIDQERAAVGEPELDEAQPVAQWIETGGLGVERDLARARHGLRDGGELLVTSDQHERRVCRRRTRVGRFVSRCAPRGLAHLDQQGRGGCGNGAWIGLGLALERMEIEREHAWAPTA